MPRRPATVALELLLAGCPVWRVARYLHTATMIEFRLASLGPGL